MLLILLTGDIINKLLTYAGHFAMEVLKLWLLFYGSNEVDFVWFCRHSAIRPLWCSHHHHSTEVRQLVEET